MPEQVKNAFDKITLQKMGKGLLIAIAGAILTFAEEFIPGIDFGAYTAIAVAFNSAIVNSVREFLKGIKVN